MKKTIITTIVLGMTSLSSPNPLVIDYVDSNSESIIVNKVEKQRDLTMFLDSLGFKESNNDYTKVNKWGYLGKYQFSKRTLRGLGYKVKPEVFLNNPQLQEQAMMDLLIDNKKVMRKQISKYVGKNINGILITESGILASTHLVGPKAVKRYLRSNGRKVKQDALGTSVEDYMELFGNYNLNI